jgi:hypothetical protein
MFSGGGLVAALCWALGGDTPEGGSAPAPPPGETGSQGPGKPTRPLETRASIELRSEMSPRFRLVELRFVIDGRQVAAHVAEEGEELAPTFGPLQARLARGRHLFTAMAVYEARDESRPSPHSRYPTESVMSFTTNRGDPPARLRVVVREQRGADVPIHQKPNLVITTKTPRPRPPALSTARAGASVPAAPGKSATKVPEAASAPAAAPSRQAAQPRRDGAGLTSARAILGY